MSVEVNNEDSNSSANSNEKGDVVVAELGDELRELDDELLIIVDEDTY